MAEQNLGRHVPRWRTAFEISSTIAMVFLAAALVVEGRTRLFDAAAAKPPLASTPAPTEPIRVDDSAAMGASSARVAIIEYADFECPACRQFDKTYAPELIRQYVDTGRVKFIFKNFPLPMHQRAGVAAAAAWCAGRQGQFWPMHDWLFSSPANLDDASIGKPAGTVRLDSAAYNSCRDGREASQHVQAEKAEGEVLHVPATPTFFIGKLTNDRRVQVSDTITGATSVDSFRKILDRLLK